MTAYRLRVSAAAKLPNLTLEEFLWRPPPLSSSFQTSIGPRVEALGQINELHSDLVRLASLVYLVDRTAERPPTWERELDLAIPVSDLGLWQSGAEALEDLLGFLSGDSWRLVFERRRMPRRTPGREFESDGLVCLLSGGADSLAGAIVHGHEGQLALVSHSDSSTASTAQNNVLAELTSLWGGVSDYQRIRLGRRTRQLGTNQEFYPEPTSRTRSFLFIALGLAAASIRGGRLLMPENGYASLNVPLSGERRGALSTRTTHPGFLEGLQAVLGQLGLGASIENPFAGKTKGQVFSEVEGVLGPEAAARTLSKSHSCAKVGAGRWEELPRDIHCGVCFGCLVRRAGFLASGLKDHTAYIDEKLTGKRRREYLSDDKLSTYRATRFAIAQGVDETDILALGVPDSVSITGAVALAEAGLKELELVQIK